MHIPAKLSRYTTILTLLLRHRHLFNHAETAEADAEAFACDLESRGPTFIKLGQLLSSRADLLPPSYSVALGRLQDHVAPFGYDDVRRIVEGELGVRISKAFGVQKVANRIALGLVLAALIVGAALIMQVPTSFRVLGYPGLAMILFVLAATGGALLAVQILAHDRIRRAVRKQ